MKQILPSEADPRLADPASRPDQAPRADAKPPVPTDFGVPVRVSKAPVIKRQEK